MKFYVRTVDFDGDKVLKKYPWLEKYEYDNNRINVNSLEDLLEITKNVGENNAIIIFGDRGEYVHGKGWVPTNEPMIEIYDAYRE